MKPAPFEYLAPRSLDSALEALTQHGEDAKLLAGGQSLMPLLNFRLLKPAVIIDLNGVPGLAAINDLGRSLAFGAMTRQSAAERSSLVRERCPLLAEAVRHIGHVAIRHRGTIGGSLVHADPSAELPALALALEASFEIIGRRGGRMVSAEDFFIDYMTTAVGPEEILKQVVLPALAPGAGYALLEIARRHGDFALAGAVSVVTLDSSGNMADARIALFGVGAKPVRARPAEDALKGRKPAPSRVREASALAREALDPFSDIHAPASYRRHVAGVLVERSLNTALGRCGREAPQR